MVTSVVAVVVDGVWAPIQSQQPVNQRADRNNVVELDASKNDVDRMVAHLGQVVRLAQNLSETDARRVRELVHATSSMLAATTYLNKTDQAQFERALRG